MLPLKAPVAQGKGVAALEVYDPTYFVSFGLAEGSDAARLSGAPAGCTTSLTRPKPPETRTAEAGKPMTEAFFEALTAADRPYKPGKTLSQALSIMAHMRKDNHIDPELFELFLRSGVHQEYARRFMRSEQIDEVVVEDYL